MKQLVLFLSLSSSFFAQSFKDPQLPIETRVQDLLSRMTPAEKAWQLFMVPSDFDTTKCRYDNGIFGIQLFANGQQDPTQQLLNYSNGQGNLELIAKANSIQHYFVEQTRLGIPLIFFDEGLHGLVRAEATSFPQAIGMAATFNPNLMAEAALQIAKEARLIGIRQVLSPVLNLASDVRWGRTEETFGEDPYLATQMGLAFVKNIELSGVICTPKHFILNVGEGGRDSYPIGLSSRALYMSHFRPFYAAFTEGKARSVMSAYNSLNGSACSSSEWLLQQTLKKDWGFKGFVISDANAVGGELVLHHTADSYAQSGEHALNGGLDVIFQTDCAHFKLFEAGYFSTQLQKNQIDSAVARVLRVKFELGLFENPYLESPSQKEIQKLLNQGWELAERCAEEAIVLLKNDTLTNGKAVLPLSKNTNILLLGEAAAQIKLGGYSGKGYKAQSILAGLTETFGADHINFLPIPEQPWADLKVTLSAENPFFETLSFQSNYFNNPHLSGAPVLTRTETQINHHWTLYGPCPETGNGFYSARWQTELKATKDTTCVIGIEGNDGFRLFINDTCVIDQWQKAGFHASTHALQLQKGQTLRFKLEFKEPQANGRIRLFYETKKHLEKHFVQLEKAIAKAHVSVVVVDFPEGEFQDRSSLRLAPEQIALIKELKVCGLPVVVVINGGSAVTMQEWQAHSSAILYAWYLGEAGGAALAHVLTGQVNPSGKLPITIPQHEGQLPLSYWHEPTGRGNDYVNGTGEPLYPFGHGLSYTQFEYHDLKIEQTSMGSNDTLNLSFTIQNTGAYPGDEALQFYIKPIYSSETLPVHYLIRTEKTRLKNGETKRYLHYKIPVAALGIPTGPKSTALPTQFYLQIGASSKDIRLQSPVITLSE
ncbi:MAG: hypothetical protein RLZZ357_1305 [Bacteroidota bacterium]|jgi:beta-glucosidase